MVQLPVNSEDCRTAGIEHWLDAWESYVKLLLMPVGEKKQTGSGIKEAVNGLFGVYPTFTEHENKKFAQQVREQGAQFFFEQVLLKAAPEIAEPLAVLAEDDDFRQSTQAMFEGKQIIKFDFGLAIWNWLAKQWEGDVSSMFRFDQFLSDTYFRPLVFGGSVAWPQDRVAWLLFVAICEFIKIRLLEEPDLEFFRLKEFSDSDRSKTPLVFTPELHRDNEGAILKFRGTRYRFNSSMLKDMAPRLRRLGIGEDSSTRWELLDAYREERSRSLNSQRGNESEKPPYRSPESLNVQIRRARGPACLIKAASSTTNKDAEALSLKLFQDTDAPDHVPHNLTRLAKLAYMLDLEQLQMLRAGESPEEVVASFARLPKLQDQLLNAFSDYLNGVGAPQLYQLP